MFLNIRTFYKFSLFVLIISYFLLRSSVLYLYYFNCKIKRRRSLITQTSHVANIMLKVFCVKLLCSENISESEESLLVGNHLGFIDIICMTALRSCVFITSLEMKRTPILGQITELGGCAYVNRVNRLSIRQELDDIVKVLQQGFRVVLYAESTSSNGEQVLPFKKTLLLAAGLAAKPIRPFVFNFLEVNGEKVSYKHRDSLCWYGDQTFLAAIWRSLKLNSIVCEIKFLPLVFTEADDNRTEIAQKLHKMVSAEFKEFRPS